MVHVKTLQSSSESHGSKAASFDVAATLNMHRSDSGRVGLAQAGLCDKRSWLLRLQVRPGLPEGTQFVFKEEGDIGGKQKAGPVGYVLKAQPHSRFTCSGSDLLYTAHIPLVHSLCGTALPVETLDGRCGVLTCTLNITFMLTPFISSCAPHPTPL